MTLIQAFLAQKQQKTLLDEAFYDAVPINENRIQAIINGKCNATIKEINNVAFYFNVHASTFWPKYNKPQIQITKYCEFCNEEFLPTNARAIYCSDKCRNKSFRANLK